MIDLPDHDTIGAAFRRCCEAYGPLPLLVVPANAKREYHPEGLELSYAEMSAAVEVVSTRYAAAGFGPGHRIGLFLENRPEHFIHKLAMNSIGACCVPINADYRSSELAY